MKQKINFIKSIKLWGVFLLIALAGIIISLDIVDSYRDFNIRAKKMRADYVTQQKQMIKQEVHRIVDMINHVRTQSEISAKGTIKKKVYDAYEIAQNIYDKFRDTKSKDEIQEIITTVLGSIRFDNSQGYYFITSLSGRNILHQLIPSFEGINIINLQDSKGNYVVKEELKLLREKGEGFVTSYWPKPDSDLKNDFRRIAFIKLFKPYNWSIGAGVYVDDVEEQIKSDLLATISRIRFGKEGYIFINRLNGDALVSNGILFSGTKKLWEVFNKHPEQMKDIFKKEYNAALKPEGDYIYYSHIKLTNPDKVSPKASFIYGIPDWQWLVGAGVYLDDVENNIALVRSELNSQLKAKMFYFIIIAVGIVALFLFLFNLLTRRLKNDFSLFISFLNRAAFSNEPIDLDMVRFVEFEQMAKNANKMLQDKIHAQQELQNEREQLSITIHSIGDGVITTDKSGRVEIVNMVAEKLTGWKAEEAKGTYLTEVFNIIDENTREAVPDPLSRVLVEGRIVGFGNHAILISKDGTEYNIADSATPITDINGNIRGVVLVFRDVTEQLKTEAELLKSKKLESVGVLAGGIAHDFNNILTALFGNIDMAKLKTSPDHPAYTYLETANQALERATDLTKQLLTFAKGGDPILGTVDLKAVVQTTVRFNLSGSNVKAHFNLPDNLWHVKADKGQISHVITNLTVNAIHAMPEGGNLYIDAENTGNLDEMVSSHVSGEFVRLCIRDEGVGILPKHIEKIFDPYFSTKQTGGGLGLAKVHSIITKHNGHVSVDSTPGVGTTFTLYLPAEKSYRKEITTIHPDLTEKPESLSGHVLVMDDQEIVRNVAAAMLDSCGYTFDFAVDGKEAIEKYISAAKSGNPFDIVIMDLTIPGGMGGKEAVKELLAIDPEAKIIVSSGYSTDPVMANYTDYGFRGRLIKPFQMKDLKKELSRIMTTG